MNNKRVPQSTNLHPSQVYSITRNCQNQNSALGHHKTERKSTLVDNRTCLGELHINRFDSESKQNLYSCQRQNSFQAKKNINKSIAMNASRWLDNQKEMMEFILSLKSKKSESKHHQGHKFSEGFQIFDNSGEKEELLCNRMLVIKKIQKHQKQAIGYFYQKDYEKCFGELGRAQILMKKEKIDSQQHQLYINYLYAQFYYKLQENQKWKAYLQKARSFISKLPTHETASMKEYILSVKALQICLYLQEQQFQKVLRQVEELRNQDKISSKIRRRIAHAQIASCRKLCRYRIALDLIDRQCQALQNDQELNEDKRQVQFAKLFQLKIEITVEFVSNQKALELIESAIGFTEVSNGEKSSFSYYNSKIYDVFAELLKKNESQKIKLIFFYEKWVETQPCKKTKMKIQLQLFKTYYDLGIYQRALQLFDSISSENVVYLGPQYLFMFANIKHFNGEISEAVSIASKIVNICQDSDSKAFYLFKILEFNLEEQGQELRNERQLLLQSFLKRAENGSCIHVADSYFQYLKKRGETERAKKFINSLRKSGNLNMSHLLQVHTNRRKSFKK